MVHAADGGIAQDLNAPDIFEFSWTKNVIDAAIVDGGVARRASEIAPSIGIATATAGRCERWIA